MALVQSSSTTFATVSSASRTFGSTPTAGNLLIWAIAGNAVFGTVTQPTGFIFFAGNSVGNLGSSFWYKFSDGTESGALSGSWTGGATSGSVAVAEYNDTASVLDGGAEDTSNVGTVVTSQGTGTASVSGTSGLLLALFAFDRADNCDTSPSYTNSFAESVVQMAAGVNRAGLVIAYKALSASGSYDCTRSCTDTGDESYGCIRAWTTGAAGHPATKRFAGVPGMARNGGVW